MIVEVGEHTGIEVAEHQFFHSVGVPIVGGHIADSGTTGIYPVVRGQRQVEIRHERPRVGLQHIEALIVERRHQLGIDGVAFAVFHRQCPLLLLTWFQAVAEGGPRQREVLVWQRAMDLCRVGVALAVLHPGEGQQQAVVIRLIVSELQVQELVVPIHSTTLDHLIAGEDTIDDMHILIGRTHLNGDRCAVVGEAGIRLVEPVVGLCGRTLVVE